MDTYALTTASFIHLNIVLDRTSERLYSGNILQLNFLECFFGTDDQKFAAKFCILDVFCHLVLLGKFIQSVWKSFEFSRFLTNLIHEPFLCVNFSNDALWEIFEKFKNL